MNTQNNDSVKQDTIIEWAILSLKSGGIYPYYNQKDAELGLVRWAPNSATVVSRTVTQWRTISQWQEHKTIDHGCLQ